jgi:8-oxo-dGTP pyrophosphatase MutT (NUDIX family)
MQSLVDTTDTAGICILHLGRNVLLLKDKTGEWGIPKGHVKEGEGMLQAALRETEEETDIKLQPKAGSFHSGVKRAYLGKNEENGDFQIFRCDVQEQMVPVLSREHTQWKYFCLVNDCLPENLGKVVEKYLKQVKKECK